MGSESVSRLKFAAVDRGTRAISTGTSGAVRPAQQYFRAERKNHGSAIQVGFDADAFRAGREDEIEGSAKDDRVRFAHIGIDGGTEDFRFHKKCCGVGPVERFCGNDPASMLEPAGVNSCEGTWSRNAGSADVTESIFWSGVECDFTRRCFPGAVGGTWAFAVAGDIALVDYLKSFDGATDVFVALGVYGIPDSNISNHRLLFADRGFFIWGEGRQLGHVEPLFRGSDTQRHCHFEYFVLRVPEGEFYSLSRPEIFFEVEIEEARSIGLGSDRGDAIAGGNRNIGDRQLASGIRVATNHGALYGNGSGAPAMTAYYQERDDGSNGRKDDGPDDQTFPNHQSLEFIKWFDARRGQFAVPTRRTLMQFHCI